MPILQWTKDAKDVLTAHAGPFTVKITPKGDGRFGWQIFTGDAHNPTATGVGASLGAAKTTTEQFVKRSGLI